jgi:hypothetical protein
VELMIRISLSFLLAAGAVAAQLPSANAVLDRYEAAIGGKAAYQRIRTVFSVTSVEFGGTGRKGTRTAYRATPNKSYTVMEIAGAGRMEDGTDGNIYWARSPFQGAHLKTGEERDIAQRAAAWNGELRLRELYPRIEVTGTEEIGGKPCYRLQFTPLSGPAMIRYFDQQSGLLLRSVMRVKTPAGDRDAETDLADYRQVQGIRTPWRIVQRGGGAEMVFTIEKLEYNVEIPASRFQVPAEILQLLK